MDSNNNHAGGEDASRGSPVENKEPRGENIVRCYSKLKGAWKEYDPIAPDPGSSRRLKKCLKRVAPSLLIKPPKAGVIDPILRKSMRIIDEILGHHMHSERDVIVVSLGALQAILTFIVARDLGTRNRLIDLASYYITDLDGLPNLLEVLFHEQDAACLTRAVKIVYILLRERGGLVRQQTLKLSYENGFRLTELVTQHLASPELTSCAEEAIAIAPALLYYYPYPPLSELESMLRAIFAFMDERERGDSALLKNDRIVNQVSQCINYMTKNLAMIVRESDDPTASKESLAVNSGVLSFLCTRHEMFDRSGDWRECRVRAIRNLALASPVIAQQLVDAGMLDILNQSLSSYEGREYEASLALTALCRLSLDNGVARAIVAHDILLPTAYSCSRHNNWWASNEWIGLAKNLVQATYRSDQALAWSHPLLQYAIAPYIENGNPYCFTDEIIMTMRYIIESIPLSIWLRELRDLPLNEMQLKLLSPCTPFSSFHLPFP